jgi:hypothetical protein
MVPVVLPPGGIDASKTTSQVSFSARAWAGLIVGFALLLLLLAVTAITLISQRQRTVLLNKQIGVLLGQTSLVLKRAAPILDAVPAQSSTISSRARSAADLVAEARPLVSALSAKRLPDTVGVAGDVLRSIDRPGMLQSTVANVDALAGAANRTNLVSRLLPLLDEVPAGSQLISQLGSLATEAQRGNLISRALGGLDDLKTLVRLQTRTLAIQVATLQNGRRTRELTADTLATAQSTLAVAKQILAVAEQTLTHAANIEDRPGAARIRGAALIARGQADLRGADAFAAAGEVVATEVSNAAGERGHGQELGERVDARMVQPLFGGPDLDDMLLESVKVEREGAGRAFRGDGHPLKDGGEARRVDVPAGARPMSPGFDTRAGPRSLESLLAGRGRVALDERTFVAQDGLE